MNTATILVPRDLGHKVDDSKEKQRAPDWEWFFAPAVGGLCELLLEGKIQKLRLSYCVTYCKQDDEKELEDVGDKFSTTSWLRKDYEGHPGGKFVAKWEDSPGIDVGTVLVLTRSPDR